MPTSAAYIMMGYYLAARAGEFSTQDDALAQLLGYRPKTMRAFLEENLPALASA